MHTQEQFISIQEINDLLLDGCKNYRSIAHRVEDARVSELLLLISSKRALMASELAQDLIQHDPYDPPSKGTLSGSLHRVLLTFRDILNNTNEVNKLVECERQDSELLERYTQVLDTTDLIEASRATLARQYSEIEEQLHRVKTSRESREEVEH